MNSNDMTAQLSSFWDQYRNKIIGGVGGAGLGAAALGGASAMSGEPGQPTDKKKLKQNLLLGAALGGVGGVGGGALYDQLAGEKNSPGYVMGFLNKLTHSRATQGAIGSAVGTPLLTHKLRGKAVEKGLGGLQTSIESAFKPNEGGVLPANDPVVRQQLKQHISSIVGGPKNSITRALGLGHAMGEQEIARMLAGKGNIQHVMPPGGGPAAAPPADVGGLIDKAMRSARGPDSLKQNLLDALSPGGGTPEAPGGIKVAPNFLDDILGKADEAGPGQAIRKQLGGDANAISRSGLGAGLRRAGTGAITWPLVTKLLGLGRTED